MRFAANVMNSVSIKVMGERGEAQSIHHIILHAPLDMPMNVEVLAAPETAFLHGLVFPVSVQYRCVCLAVKHGSVLSQRALPMVGVLHIVLRSYACLRPSRVDG